MPHFRKPQDSFGIKKLPRPVRSLVEFAFPQEPDITPAVPGTTVAGKGVKVGFKAAREKFSPIIKELRNILRPVSVTPDEVFKIFQQEKSTPFRVPSATNVKLPKEAEGKLSLTLPFKQRRNPKLVGRQKLQGRYYNLQPDLQAPAYPGTGRPSVSEGSKGIKKEINKRIESPAIKGLRDLEDVVKVISGVPAEPKTLLPKRSKEVLPRTPGQKIPLSKVSPELIEEIQRKVGTSQLDSQELNRKYYPYLTEETFRSIVKMPWKWK